MIGIFDSGSGGLTVLKALREELPSADILYFGDVKNAPYGEKTPQELSHLTVLGMKLLKERGAERLVNACNTMSASLSVSLFDLLPIAPDDVVEMVGPTVALFKDSPFRIALCATPATVASGIYQDAFTLIGKEVRAIPIPSLAADIEFGGSEQVMAEKIKTAFSGFDFSAVDVLLLACTHYPLITNIFRPLLPASVALVDPAHAVAGRAKARFWPRETGDGSLRFLISKESEHFRARARELFPNTNYSVEVVG